MRKVIMTKSAFRLLMIMIVMSFFSCSEDHYVLIESDDCVPPEFPLEEIHCDFLLDYNCFGKARTGGVRIVKNGMTAYPSTCDIRIFENDQIELQFGFRDYNSLPNPTPVNIQIKFCTPFIISAEDFFDRTTMHDSSGALDAHFINYEIQFGDVCLSLEQFVFQGKYNPAKCKDYFFKFYENVLRRRLPQAFSSRLKESLFDFYSLPVNSDNKYGGIIPLKDWRGMSSMLHRDRAENHVGYNANAEIVYDQEGFPAALNYIDGSNWMSFIADSTRLQDLIIPGSHDAMTYSVDAIASAFTCIAVDQWHTAYNQAEFGIRYFDIRTGCSMDNLSALCAAHGIATSYYYNKTLEMQDMLGGLVGWLKEHPSETVILNISDEDNFNLFLHETKPIYGTTAVYHTLTYNPKRYFVTFEEGLGFNHGVDLVQWYPDITLGEMRGKICVFYSPTTSAKFSAGVSASVTQSQVRNDVSEPLFMCGFENFDPSTVEVDKTVTPQTVLAAWEKGYTERGSRYVCTNYVHGNTEEFKYMSQNIYELSDTWPYEKKEFGEDDAYLHNLKRKYEMSSAIWDICKDRRDIMPFVSCTGYYGLGLSCVEEYLCENTQSNAPYRLEESIIDCLKRKPHARGVVTLDFVGTDVVYDTDLEDWGKTEYGPFNVGGLYAVNVCWQHNFLGGNNSLYKCDVAKDLSTKYVNFR